MKTCTPLIDAADLPNRGPIVIAREQRVLPMMVLRLENRPKASPNGALARFTIELLADGFRERAATRLPAAGFLAGRCSPPKQSDASKLNGWLADVVESLDPANLRSMAPSYVECAMSIGLRGDHDTARAALTAVVSGGGVGSTHDWQAAYYLAQYGDPAGWPALLATLDRPDEHSRLMATRHLFGFCAFDRQTLDDYGIDVVSELVARLDDVPYVAVEVPGLLAECVSDGVHELLASIADSSHGDEVRAAAADVLAGLDD